MSAKATSCGWWICRPQWLQRWANPKTFLWVYGLLGTTQTMAYVYFVATLTTMERRFKIPSKTTGLMLSGNEISQILLSLLLTYFGGRGNRPRWIACGVAISALSCFILALPHAMYGPGRDALALTKEFNAAVNDSYMQSSIMGLTSPKCGTEFAKRASEMEEACLTADENNSTDGNYSLVPILLIFLSQFVLGIGTTLYWALGQIYLDDNTRKTKTPLLLGMTLALRTLGPALGFVISFGCLSMYIDPFMTPVINKQDPRWLGAWWLGWIFLGLLMLVFAMLISLFPRSLPPKRSKSGAPLLSPAEPEKPRLKDFPTALKRILCNKLLMTNIMSSVFYILGASGYITYSIKYMEIQYNKSAAGASMLAGTSGLLAMTFGFLISGIVISKFQPRPRIVLFWNVIAGLAYVLAEVCFIFIGCPDDIVHGTNSLGTPFQLNSECNSGCACPADIRFSPVCIEGTTFYSACHAGCDTQYAGLEGIQRNVTFSNCSCAGAAFPQNNFTVPEVFGSILATEGTCIQDCRYMFIWFIVGTCFMHMIGSSARVGNILVNFRCVEPMDKAFAQGLALVLISLLALIPGPIIFGILIDASCLIWDESCGKRGNCSLYEKSKFRYFMNVGAASITLIAVILDLVVWYLGKDLDLYGADEQDEPEQQKPRRIHRKA
ncbi:solute carrier organic anion transporter family member 74D [Neocloeon triangulifer]|uniref:solute carrier organic anion transporter family member 74D n=1 Tax=Neocloeon triangulifer TaxID=2078957 RepID=UPI00286F9858|nr:solute carrier organic anion transporter family member 74D [Neocloeon triangulifer]XP_059483093.1 solute carrier organic anion transporter family member 74D [Neocloeon triangulifer]